ncbi:MAG: hypothetical protein N3F07_02420 [Candidatus Micrarchaeota archaeon]|nr:hypothetical protein [Candidatus Micrarchaeota archaeon]
MRDAMAQRFSKGFFFTVMALVILSFMLFTVQIWVRALEQSDQRQAQRFKGEATRLALSSISDKSISDFANASAFYATFKLANYSSQAGAGLASSQSSDPKNPQTGEVEKAILSLMRNGTTALAPPLNYSQEEFEAYTIESWKQKMRSAAAATGFSVSFSEPYNMKISQKDAWTVGVSFEMDLNISDFENTLRQSKKLKANSSFSIVGMPDPFVHRNDMARRGVPSGLAASKQIFRNPLYRFPSDLAPKNAFNGTRGFGWFYGAVMTDYPSSPDDLEQPLSQMILVKNWDENISSYAPLFGAVVITNLPEYEYYNYTDPDTGCQFTARSETKCLNCVTRYFSSQPGCAKAPEVRNKTSSPYMATDGSAWLSRIPQVARQGLRSQRYILIDNPKETPEEALDDADHHHIWDMSAIRDASICGFYVESPLAPSFFQRMLAQAGVSSDAGSLRSDYGIESFLVGRWAGGSDDASNGGQHQRLTKLDWVFYSTYPPQTEALTPRIKGMMGCKSKDMCSSNDPNQIGVGFFRLRNEDVARYGLNLTACNVDSRFPRMAPCS